MILTDEFKQISPLDNYSTYTLKCIEQYLSESDLSDVLNSQYADVWERQKLLVSATVASNITLIKDLLNSGVSVEVAEYNKLCLYEHKYFMTPLQIATARGDRDTLECLIRLGANVNCKDRYDITPIHMAAEQGHYECLRMLLQVGAKCCPVFYFERTPFNPVPFYDGTTPLHLAVSNKDILCMKEIINYSADYKVVDELGRNPLYIASELGAEECVLILLRSTIGCDRDILSMPGFKSGDTPLHFAITHGMWESTKELLQLGADVYYKNNDGFSPMDICLEYLQSDSELSIKLLKMLVLYGCNTDINRRDPKGYTMLLRMMCSNNIKGSRKFAKFLIAFGANTEFKFSSHLSLLQNELFKWFESDPSILKAILDTKCFPPRLDCHFLKCRRAKKLAAIAISKNTKSTHSHYHGEKNHMINWYEMSYPYLPSLQHLCRFTIREAMGSQRLNKVKNLPIPYKFITYILLGVQV